VHARVMIYTHTHITDIHLHSIFTCILSNSQLISEIQLDLPQKDMLISWAPDSFSIEVWWLTLQGPHPSHPEVLKNYPENNRIWIIESLGLRRFHKQNPHFERQVATVACKSSWSQWCCFRWLCWVLSLLYHIILFFSN
jgi:hypothetical protein